VERLVLEKSTLRSLAIRITRQYATLLLLPFYWRLAAYEPGPTKVPRATFDELREELEKIRNLWEGLEDAKQEGEVGQPIGPGWVAASIFSPALSALALHAHLSLKGNIAKAAKSDKHWQLWLDICKPFIPHVAAFDKYHCLVGESQPRWPGVKPLQDWEQALRDARFSRSVRLLLSDGRNILKKSGCIPLKEITNPVEQFLLSDDILNKPGCVPLREVTVEVDQAILRDQGQAALRGSQVQAEIMTICSRSKWLALYIANSCPINQCSTCQCLFQDVRLSRANSGPHDILGSRWDTDRPWQCAEADLLAQCIACIETNND
jgi:hypothetical protein